MPLSELCTMWSAIPCKIAEQVEQQISVKFCVKLEHSFVEIIQMTQNAAAMGNW